MKTELVFVGKTSDKRFEAAIDDYVKLWNTTCL